MIIQAEAGVGKSTLAAHLAWKRQWPCHFTQLAGGRAPEAARKNLAAPLITQWDLQQEWAPEGVLPVASSRPGWFSQLLEAVAYKRDHQASDQAQREPVVIVVDGLDEAEPEAAGGRGLPLGFPKSLPDGVYVVATSRVGIDRALHAVRNPAEWLEIEVEHTPDGRRALAAFDLCLHDWEAATLAARLDRLTANAARVQAHALSAACRNAGSEWPVHWAAWTGQDTEGWPTMRARCTRWPSGGLGAGMSSSPAPMTARCGSGMLSLATRLACLWPVMRAW